MSSQRLHTLLSYVRCTVRAPRSPAATDAQLLDRFVRHRDEAAFERLVCAHGPLVLSVCWRVLRDQHAAEDAFQATFLTLACKAGSIGKGASLSSWLYKVAYRISLRTRARAARHAACEHPLHTLPAADAGIEPPDRAAWRELRQVLDSEVHRLPEKYRAAFVLCYLEGKTNEEAAKALGCPKGTVLSRLARARDWLRHRLTRRGLALSALPFAALLAERADALAKMTPVLVNATVHLGLLALLGNLMAEQATNPAVLLMQDAAHELSTGKRKSLFVAAGALLLLVGGAGAWAYYGWAATAAGRPSAGGPASGAPGLPPPPAIGPGGCCPGPAGP